MKHKVLFVDDEAVIRDMVKTAFANEPYGLITAGSAEEGLDILAAESVDVVISDEIMTGMSGSEFLSFVRKKYPDTIRIILTGKANLEAVIRAIREGFHGSCIGNGNYSADEARERIDDGLCDLVSFGRPFISNPDLPERLRRNAPLNEWDMATFYGGDAHGYTDYPALD